MAGLALAACQTTNVTPQQAGLRPDLKTDEAGLWHVMDKEENRLKTSPNLVRDPALNAYVGDIVCEMAGEYCSDVRVYILDKPYFNATMAPNGAMQIWSGLLYRAENEAQLSFVIGHELSHYIERHSLESWRKTKNAANASMLFQIGAAAAGVGALGALGDLAAVSSIQGHSREKEREADADGYARMTKAGYDGREAAEMWEYLVSEVGQSVSDKKKKKEAKASIFDSHPVSTDRIEALQSLAADVTDGTVDASEYQQLLSPHMEKWLRGEVRRRDFGESLHLFDAMIGRNQNPGIAHYYKGEVYRIRREEGDAKLALEAYIAASHHEDAPEETWRQIGQLQMKADNSSEALASFETYLKKLPNAQDRMLIESYIGRLKSEDQS